MLSDPNLKLRDKATQATCPHGRSVMLQPGQSITRNGVCACGQQMGKKGG